MTFISQEKKLNLWDNLPPHIKSERTIVHERRSWQVGDFVTLWYLDYAEYWKVTKMIARDVCVSDVRCTSRVEDFSDAEKYKRYMARPKIPRLRQSIIEAGRILKPIFCVRHLNDTAVDHQLVDGKFTDLRVVDGHHRLLLAREQGIKTIPTLTYELERIYMTRDEIAKEVQRMQYPWNPWNHSIDLKNGVVTPGGYRPTVDQKWALLGRALKPDFKGSKVADLGCCEGGLTLKMVEAGADHVTGVDIEPERVDRANFCLGVLNLRDKVKIVNSDIDDFLRDAQPDQFDVVVALSVIHHNKEKEEFFARALNILKPGGYMILESRGPNHSKEEVRANGRISTGLCKRWYEEARCDGYKFEVTNITVPSETGGDFKWWTRAQKVKA